mmetsp:Transcript_7762/g.15503  ORF Transcript_7762/g.15503 Transcript_7762/m.15503 type:complete len:1075 (+) Transcript_7762:163-3387(+)
MAGFSKKLKRLVSKKNVKKDDNAGEPIETKPAQATGGKEVETIKSIKTGGSGSTAASTSNKNNAATAASAADRPTKFAAAAAAAPKEKAAGSTKPGPSKTSKTQSPQGTMQKTSAAKTPNQKRSSKPPSVSKSSTAGADGKGSAVKASGGDANTKLSAKVSVDQGSSRNFVKASTKGLVVKQPAKDKTEEESIKELDGIMKELRISADIAVPTSLDHCDGVSEFSGGSAKSLESESEEEETDEEEEEEEEESNKAASDAAKTSQTRNGGDSKAVSKVIPVPPKSPSFQSELSVKTEIVVEDVEDCAKDKPAKVGNESVKGSEGTGTAPAKGSAKTSVKSNAPKTTAKASGKKSKGSGGKESSIGNNTNGSASNGPARSNANHIQSAKSNASKATPIGKGSVENIAGIGGVSKDGAKASATQVSAKGGTTKVFESISVNGAKKTTGGDIKGIKKKSAPIASANQEGDSSKPENSKESGNVKTPPSSTPDDTQPKGDAKTAEAVPAGASLDTIAPAKKKSLFSKAFKSSKGVCAKKSPDVKACDRKTEPSPVKISPVTVVVTEKTSNPSGDSTGKKSPPNEVASDAKVAAAAMAVEPANDKKLKTSKAQARESSKLRSRSNKTEAPATVASVRAEKVSRQSPDQQLPPTSSGRNGNHPHVYEDDISEEDREEFSQLSDGESIEMRRQQSGNISLYTKSTYGETMTFETHLDDIDEDDNDSMGDTEAIKHSDVIINEPGDPSDLLIRVLYWKPQLEFGNDVIVQVEASTVSFRDCLLRRDIGPDKAKFPLVPGCEVVGTITLLNQKAKKEGYRIGDRVAAMSRTGGGNATYASYPVSCIAPISKNVDAAEAVCLVDVYMTAHQALRLSKKQATPLTGSNVLITDGFTPIGQACVQLALMEGANVYVTAMESTQESYLKSIGAKCLPFEPSNWLPKIQGRMDVVIDNTCFDSYDSSWKALNPNGVLVCTGMTSLYSVLDQEGELYGCDAFGDVTVKIQAMWAETKAKYMMSRTVFHDMYASMQSDPKVYQQDLKYLCFMLERSRIKPKIDYRIGIGEVSDCHRRIESGKANGTIVCLP